MEKTASADGVKLLGDSVIIGFTPSQAVQETLEALKAGLRRWEARGIKVVLEPHGCTASHLKVLTYFDWFKI